jgi:hypothetical protein
VEYEIQEALNGTLKDKNQDQRRKGRSFAQCPKSRMKPWGCAAFAQPI